MLVLRYGVDHRGTLPIINIKVRLKILRRSRPNAYVNKVVLKSLMPPEGAA